MSKPVANIAGDADGAVMVASGRYARAAVLTAFEMMGGVEALAAWGDEHRSDFYTKVFTKTIQKEISVDDTRGVEDLLEELHGELLEGTATVLEPPVVDRADPWAAAADRYMDAEAEDA